MISIYQRVYIINAHIYFNTNFYVNSMNKYDFFQQRKY